ncbi:MAG: hypothetical protein PHR26_01485 [Candidatus ainarchaeum sp.]|nr:hypothetical protein [Candidatus ainarchaeum sp.]MDD3976318.1 hypothetical protein [Candidatus ainarchaeum sp.]
MDQLSKYIFAIFIFFIAYLFLNNSSLFVVPIISVLIIFLIFFMLPDISSKESFVSENKFFFIFLIVFISILYFIKTKLILTSLLIIIGMFIFNIFMNNEKVMKSLSTGFLLSFPLLLVGQIYFIFAFLGFFTSWFSYKF